MAMSGIKVADSVKEGYERVNKKKRGACAFKISDDTKTIEEDTSFVCDEKEKRPYRKLLDHFQSNNCKYGLVDVKFKDTEGKKQNKLVCICWASDLAKPKLKMMQTTSFEALKPVMDSCQHFFQMNDDTQKNAHYVLDKACGSASTARRFEGKKYCVDKRTKEYLTDGEDSEESD